MSGGDWAAPMQRRNPSSFLYGGGLQIPQFTWDRLGGPEFAATPAAATREQQITVAERIIAEVGESTEWANCP